MQASGPTSQGRPQGFRRGGRFYDASGWRRELRTLCSNYALRILFGEPTGSEGEATEPDDVARKRSMARKMVRKKSASSQEVQQKKKAGKRPLTRTASQNADDNEGSSDSSSGSVSSSEGDFTSDSEFGSLSQSRGTKRPRGRGGSHRESSVEERNRTGSSAKKARVFEQSKETRETDAAESHQKSPIGGGASSSSGARTVLPEEKHSFTDFNIFGSRSSGSIVNTTEGSVDPFYSSAGRGARWRPPLSEDMARKLDEAVENQCRAFGVHPDDPQFSDKAIYAALKRRWHGDEKHHRPDHQNRALAKAATTLIEAMSHAMPKEQCAVQNLRAFSRMRNVGPWILDQVLGELQHPGRRPPPGPVPDPSSRQHPYSYSGTTTAEHKEGSHSHGASAAVENKKNGSNNMPHEKARAAAGTKGKSSSSSSSGLQQPESQKGNMPSTSKSTHGGGRKGTSSASAKGTSKNIPRMKGCSTTVTTNHSSVSSRRVEPNHNQYPPTAVRPQTHDHVAYEVARHCSRPPVSSHGISNFCKDDHDHVASEGKGPPLSTRPTSSGADGPGRTIFGGGAVGVGGGDAAERTFFGGGAVGVGGGHGPGRTVFGGSGIHLNADDPTSRRVGHAASVSTSAAASASTSKSSDGEYITGDANTAIKNVMQTFSRSEVFPRAQPNRGTTLRREPLQPRTEMTSSTQTRRGDRINDTRESAAQLPQRTESLGLAASSSNTRAGGLGKGSGLREVLLATDLLAAGFQAAKGTNSMKSQQGPPSAKAAVPANPARELHRTRTAGSTAISISSRLANTTVSASSSSTPSSLGGTTSSVPNKQQPFCPPNRVQPPLLERFRRISGDESTTAAPPSPAVVRNERPPMHQLSLGVPCLTPEADRSKVRQRSIDPQRLPGPPKGRVIDLDDESSDGETKPEIVPQHRMASPYSRQSNGVPVPPVEEQASASCSQARHSQHALERQNEVSPDQLSRPATAWAPQPNGAAVPVLLQQMAVQGNASTKTCAPTKERRTKDKLVDWAYVDSTGRGVRQRSAADRRRVGAAKRIEFHVKVFKSSDGSENNVTMQEGWLADAKAPLEKDLPEDHMMATMHLL
ncbi:unnamed protein product [Amoebophrya sp. A25]|nr:unnamed protein product [Amoebophrya sp. A25]|eukprot:GSA25T00018971001.1